MPLRRPRSPWGPAAPRGAGAPGATRLDGPPPVLPAVVDRALERWGTLPPRARAAAALAVVLVVAGGGVARVARSPYGPPVAVLVATRDLGVGSSPAGGVAPARRPADLVPADAIVELPPDAALALGVVAGTVMTARHLQPGGPFAGLGDGAAAVAVPSGTVPGASPGRRFDLIVTRADGGGAVVATDARVLAVGGDLVWLAVPRAAAPDVAAAVSRGLLSAAVLPG